MRGMVKVLVALVLVSGFLYVELLAESHQIELLRAVQIDGVKLKPGKYKLTLNGDNIAELHKGRKLLVKARVETTPLAGATPNSVSQSVGGELLEIRLDDQKVKFVKARLASK